MASHERERASQSDRKARVRQRLVPPRRRVHTAKLEEAGEELRWAKSLHGQGRGRLVMIFGNLLLLLALVGGPYLRGRERARTTWQAQAAFTACLLGTKLRGSPGLGAPHEEAEHFAAQALKADARWPRRCEPLLRTVAPEPAFVLLPSVKGAEANVREAVRVLTVELRAMHSYRVGARIPVRPLRALDQLRNMIREQAAQAGWVSPPVQPVVTTDGVPAPPAGASLPLYAGADAVLSLWGNDQVLYAVAVDRTGVSYLESQPGRPYVRARLVRPLLLSAFLPGETAPLLLWSTPKKRCEEKPGGCHAKTTGIAVAPVPLLEIPAQRLIAAHVAGRPDRSLLFARDRVFFASTTQSRRVAIHSLLFSPEIVTGKDMPPLLPQVTWQGEYDDVLFARAGNEAYALATVSTGETSDLRLASPAGVDLPITQLPGRGAFYSACSDSGRVGFALGNGATLQLGELEGQRVRLWPVVSMRTESAIHETDPGRDQVLRLCNGEGASAVVLDATKRLHVLSCPQAHAACALRTVADEVTHFAAVSTAKEILIAYAGADVAPQIRVRSLDRAAAVLSPTRVPSPCWDNKRGFCGEPVLVRLGARIVLGAREGTDLLLLESADQGHTWTTPPVL